MKRTLVILAITCFLIILLIMHELYLALVLPLLLIAYSVKKRWLVFCMICCGLMMASCVFRIQYYASYENQKTEDVVVKITEYAGDYKMTLNQFSILIRSDGQKLPTGIYQASFVKFVFQYKNPHTFNYKKYLYAKGFVDVVTLETLKLKPLDVKEISLNYKIEKSPYSGFYNALLFGDKSHLDMTVFQNNGTSHILAISGLHIGLIYGLVYGLLFLIPKSIRSTCALVAVFLYILFIGMPVSAVRAWLMIALGVFANVTCRKYDVLQTLGLIVLLLMMINPFIIYHAGFQYSFTAVLVIEAVYKSLFRKIKNKWLQIVLLPGVIFIGMAPLTLYHQNMLHLLSFVINIVSVFLIAWVLYGLLIFKVLQWPVILSFVDFIFEIIYQFNEWMDSLNQFKFISPSPPLIGVLMFYFVLALYKEESYRKYLGYITVCILSCWILYQNVVVEMYFFDIGQGDAILIKKGFDTLLIDGGKQTTHGVLKEVLLKQGIGQVDILMLSHSDMDHLGGFLDIPEMVLESTLLYKEPNEKKEGFQRLKVAQRIPCYSGTLDLGFVELEFLPYKSGDSYNNASLLSYVYIYDTVVLFTGDIEAEVERRLSFKQVDILKVPHHGSKTSSTPELLKQTMPKHAVICVGKNNYGHPHKEVMLRYNEENIPVYETQKGCVKVWVLPFNIYFVKTLN